MSLVQSAITRVDVSSPVVVDISCGGGMLWYLSMVVAMVATRRVLACVSHLGGGGGFVLL